MFAIYMNGDILCEMVNIYDSSVTNYFNLSCRKTYEIDNGFFRTKSQICSVPFNIFCIIISELLAKRKKKFLIFPGHFYLCTLRQPFCILHGNFLLSQFANDSQGLSGLNDLIARAIFLP